MLVFTVLVLYSLQPINLILGNSADSKRRERCLLDPCSSLFELDNGSTIARSKMLIVKHKSKNIFDENAKELLSSLKDVG